LVAKVEEHQDPTAKRIFLVEEELQHGFVAVGNQEIWYSRNERLEIVIVRQRFQRPTDYFFVSFH
jgi:hypothetical protein